MATLGGRASYALAVKPAGSGSSAVQWGQRVAPSATSSRQYGQCGASFSCACLPCFASERALFRAFTIRNTTNAMMTNWMTALMKLP